MKIEDCKVGDKIKIELGGKEYDTTIVAYDSGDGDCILGWFPGEEPLPMGSFPTAVLAPKIQAIITAGFVFSTTNLAQQALVNSGAEYGCWVRGFQDVISVISNTATQPQSNTIIDYGATCKGCGTFNEYVVKSDIYKCYSCRQRG